MCLKEAFMVSQKLHDALVRQPEKWGFAGDISTCVCKWEFALFSGF